MTFLDYASFLNQTGISESVPSEINMMFGYLFLFIGIVFLYSVFDKYKKDKKRLKLMG